jgi:hypothetical protein
MLSVEALDEVLGGGSGSIVSEDELMERLWVFVINIVRF